MPNLSNTEVPPGAVAEAGAASAPPAPLARLAPVKPFRIRLPGLLSEGDIGLGQAVSQAAARAGFRACGGCRARAEALNHWIVFTGRGSA